MTYAGEHPIFGQLGHLFVALAFASALLSCISYFAGLNKGLINNSWQRLGRIAFGIHSFAVAGIVVTMFYLIYNHYFEYYYVWYHSSLTLPFRYMFACFWEGQEGSFLLWTVWHVILSWFIIRKGGEWEAPVVGVIATVQVFLTSMLLGVYVFGYKLGSDPFIYLRDNPEMSNLPFIKMADYLSRIKDGRGLNPLLQNYWMVIHPPTLFLGFASTVVPFAFAIGGLIKGKYTEWVKPAIPWAFFGVMILGTGVLMGAAWAYEALSFGGFWAWDPVENASLVPWLTFVGAAHLMLVFKNRGHSILSTYIFTIVTFLLVLYSTFLTRSGILGSTSVHAFTDLGMSGQLVVYMAFYVLLSVYLLVKNRKKLPRTEAEEEMGSREFWMFIGTLVLMISAMQITFTTSIPVFDKLGLYHVTNFLGTILNFFIKIINNLFNAGIHLLEKRHNLSPPDDPKAHYNLWQLPIAIILGILTAIGQFFKYKNTNTQEWLKKISIPFFLSVILAALFSWQLELNRINYFILLFTSLFTVIANFDFMVRVLKLKINLSGASIAHIGFGLILMGVLISNAKSTIISENKTFINLGKDFPNNENVMLIKGDTVAMNKYYISYKGRRRGTDVTDEKNLYYTIEYFKRNKETSKLEKEFELQPIVQLNQRMGNVPEPATKRFLTKDIYTHITYPDLEDIEGPNTDSLYRKPITKQMKVGDTIALINSLMTLTGIDKDVNKDLLKLNKTDLAAGAVIKLIDYNKHETIIEPVMVVRGNTLFSIPVTVDSMGLKIDFPKINPETGKADIVILEKKKNEFIIMKAIIFPWINLLWLGALLMILGCLLAIRQRRKTNRD
jgi:cytochrome c-type biogenesis protein CcmF